MSPPDMSTSPGGAAVWHDLECGAYTADLALWLELARGAANQPAQILDLGCGTGRVALRLAAAGHELTGLDIDRDLLATLHARAAQQDLHVVGTQGDAREFDLARQFDLVLAPMQLVQLMESDTERLALLGHARDHLLPGGIFAAALLDLEGEPIDGDYGQPLPDMREQEGWVFSSQPLMIRTVHGGRAISLDRLRQAVSPAGEVHEEASRVWLMLLAPERLEQELRIAGLEPAGRRRIPATDDHVGSVVVIARRPR
jgi:SAM-dependent methyltransferase